jgi:uncharacterized surface protein with fasciclin (FAS1) repeats
VPSSPVRVAYALILALAVASALGCDAADRDAASSAPSPVPSTRTIVAVLGDPDLQIMWQAVRTAGLEARLSGPGPYTLIAPDDAAFSVVPARERSRLGSERPRARALVLDSLLAGRLPQGEIRDGLQCRTMVSSDSIAEAGHRVTWTVSDGEIRIDGATVTDIVEAGNGIVYVVDRALPSAPEVWSRPMRASPGDRVTVFCRWRDADGTPVAGARCLFVWHFGTSQPHVTRVTDTAGLARCAVRVPSSASVDTVLVTVTTSGSRPTRTVVAAFSIR